MKIRILNESFNSMMKGGDIPAIHQAIELAMQTEEIPYSEEVQAGETWLVIKYTGPSRDSPDYVPFKSEEIAEEFKTWLQGYGIPEGGGPGRAEPKNAEVFYWSSYTEPNFARHGNEAYTKVFIQKAKERESTGSPLPGGGAVAGPPWLRTKRPLTDPTLEIRDPEGEHISQYRHGSAIDPEGELIREAVENIIPPAMSALVELIKNQDLPNPAAEDVLAKYLMDYGPVMQGAGRGFDSSFVNRTFMNGVVNGFGAKGPRRWMIDALPDGMELGNSINHISPEGSFFWHVREITGLFSTDPVYNSKTRDSYPSAGMNWLKKHRDFLRPSGKVVDSMGDAIDDSDPAKAMLTMAQQYKSYTKQLKKYFRKNPEVQKWEEDTFKGIEEKWKDGIATWFRQVFPKFRGMIKYLKAHKDNHNKLSHIMDTHPRVSDYDHETGEVLKDSAWDTADTHITTWQTMAQLVDCPDEKPVKGPPCVFKRDEAGYFWFNHGAPRMVNCDADDFGGCAVANYDDSILLMLQSGDLQSDEGLKKHVMVEWNSGRHNMIQILGFGNTFPDKLYWDHVKDLWEFLGKPKLDQKAWQHLTKERRATEEEIQEFLNHIGFGQDKTKTKPANMADLATRIDEGVYTFEADAPMTMTLTTGQEAQRTHRYTLQFKRLFGKNPMEKGALRVDISFRHMYDEAKPGAAVDWLNKGLKAMKTENRRSFYYDLETNFINETDLYLERETGDFPIPEIKISTVSTHIKITTRIRLTFKSDHFLGEEPTPDPGVWRTADFMDPERVHHYIMGDDDGGGLRAAFTMQRMKLLATRIKENAIAWVDSHGPKGILRHDDGRESEWQPGMPTPGFQGTDNPEGVGDVRPLDLEGNVIPPAALGHRMARRWEEGTALSDEEAEERWNHLTARLERGEELNSIFRAEIYVIQNRFDMREAKTIVREILAEKKSGGVKIRIPLDEIKTTYAGGKGWLAGVGKLPVGDNPKGPYPSGGEVAHKIGNYKIKVRTKDIMKEPVKPVVPGEEPSMEFIEEKKKDFACGILPYKGEGENIQFLIGKAPQGWWDLFKGKMDEGETEQEAAKREFEEESSFKFKGSLDDAIVLTHKKLKIWLVEMPELDAGQFDVSKVSKITGEYLNGRPEIEKIGWFGPAEAENKLNKKQMPFIGLAMEKLGGEVISESKEITKLRIFDFDETIAFTTSRVYIKTPEKEELPPMEQQAFDAFLNKQGKDIEELEAEGYSFDFSEYSKVNSPQLNNKVVSHLKRIVNKNRAEPIRAVYVMTARSPEAKGAIVKYLSDEGFKSSDFAGVLTLGGGSKKDAIIKLTKQYPNVNSIAFWDDSDRNISDVQQLRSIYPEMDIQINHVVDGTPRAVEEEILNEALGMIGWHVTNENNRDSIIKTGIMTSGGSTDEINPDYGEGRVYFFSGDYDYDREEDRGFESAKMAMFEENVVGNPKPPYIIIPFNLKKVSGETFPDPELAKHDIYGPDSYYLVGEVPPEAIIASHIKHENELKRTKPEDLKESKVRIRIIENRQMVVESEGEKLAKQLLQKLDKEAEEIQAKATGQEEEELEEAVVMGFFVGVALAKAIIPFVLSMIGTLAVGGALAKFANGVQKKFTGQNMNVLSGFGEVLEWGSTFLSTLGFATGGKFLISNLPGIEAGTKQKWLERLELTEKIIVFAITIYCLYTEIYKAAEAAGGAGDLIAKLAGEAGIQDGQVNSAMAELFTGSVDTVDTAGQVTEITINRQAFFAHLKRSVRRAWG